MSVPAIGAVEVLRVETTHGAQVVDAAPVGADLHEEIDDVVGRVVLGLEGVAEGDV